MLFSSRFWGLSKLNSEVEVLLIALLNGLEGVLGQVEEAGVTDPPVNIKGLESLEVLVKEFLGDGETVAKLWWSEETAEKHEKSGRPP